MREESGNRAKWMEEDELCVYVYSGGADLLSAARGWGWAGVISLMGCCRGEW